MSNERLVRHSLYIVLADVLGELGWLDPALNRRDVELRYEPIDWHEPIEANLVGLAVEQTFLEQAEVGNASFNANVDHYVISVLAEDDSVGVHLVGDIRNVLGGRLVWERPSFTVMNYELTTPVPIGYATIDTVRAERVPSRFEHPWLSRWFEIRCLITRHFD